jgi:hypothetical protein
VHTHQSLGQPSANGALLPKFEIAAKHYQSRLGEGIGDGNQKWSGAIASGPMRQNDPLPVGLGGMMHEAANAALINGIAFVCGFGMGHGSSPQSFDFLGA